MEATIKLEDLLDEDELNEEIALGPYPSSTRSQKGFTLDTTLIVNSRVVTVRNLRDQGLITPVATQTVQGVGPGQIIVMLYEAVFNDRERSFVITEETYRSIVQNVEPHNEDLDSDAVDRVQLSMEPITDDRMESKEAAVDSKGRTREYRDDTRFPAHTREP